MPAAIAFMPAVFLWRAFSIGLPFYAEAERAAAGAAFFFRLLFKKPAYYTAGNQDEKCSKFLDYHG